ncbi:MAG: nicotinamide-nucleotide amidohydrolase family protein [Anaerolineaceae bacterium]|nr:nicotinamide-nucleotide amidohydrolase family protein [Anaerolineaceae bacterium]
MGQKLLEEQVGELLRERGWTISAAESCTGGLVMHRLTNVPGSSVYVMGGVVAYSNAAKQSLLRVRQGTLIAHGAVSEQTASEMATGVQTLLGTDVSVSITGIAGPDGGTPEKPVGLTYIGLAGPDGLVVVNRHIWDGDREAVKAASASAALQLVLDTFA